MSYEDDLAVKRCEQTDLPVDGCAHCRPPAPDPDWSDVDVKARYGGGKCALNPDHRIRQGENIGRVEDVGWICQHCCEEARRYRP